MNVQNNTKQDSKSVYGSTPESQKIESHTLSIFVDNESGVLARVIGLFSGRGYNIESLTVAEIDHDENISRITIVSSGTSQVIAQIKHQLERMVPVHKVFDLTIAGSHVSRELALIKILASQSEQEKLLEIASKYNAVDIDSTDNSIIFQIADDLKNVEKFIGEMKQKYNVTNISRTGTVAMMRGDITL